MWGQWNEVSGTGHLCSFFWSLFLVFPAYGELPPLVGWSLMWGEKGPRLLVQRTKTQSCGLSHKDIKLLGPTYKLEKNSI